MNNKNFMKPGYDRSFVFRDQQGRMISETPKAQKSKVVASSKSVSKMPKKATSKAPVKIVKKPAKKATSTKSMAKKTKKK